MVRLNKVALLALASEAIESGDATDLRYSREKLNALADISRNKEPIVDALILIAGKFAEKGLYGEALHTSKIAIDHAHIRSPQEEKIVTNILEYTDHLTYPSQRKSACGTALRYVDTDTPLQHRIFETLGRIEVETWPGALGRANPPSSAQPG